MSVFWRPRGCVLWYDFAELSGDTVYDLSGNNNHGTIYGAQWRRGHLIGALEFDGVDDCVIVPESPSLDISGNQISLEAYICIKSTGSYPCIISKYWSAYELLLHADTTRLRFDITLEGTEIKAHTADELELDKWYHVAYVYTGDSHHIFVNGEDKELVWIEEGYGNISTNDYDVAVGSRPNKTCFFNGIIAFARIYNRALSEREIRAHANYLLQKYIAHPPFI